MDMQRKKELLNQWKNRHPEMGIIAITCKATGEIFADISTDIQFAFNRHRFQLSANLHPNKQLQKLWEQYGEDGFAYTVVKTLSYDDPQEDQTEKLGMLLEEYFSETSQARRLTR